MTLLEARSRRTPDRGAADSGAAGPVIGRARPALRGTLPAVAVLASMSCVQVGAALSVPLFAVLGVAGTTWARLAVAAVVLLIVARPRGMRRADVAVAAGLGAVMAANTLAFAAAVARVPLGTVVAVEFCGPLAVAAAAARGRRLRALTAPGLALAGVLLVTAPWRLGGADGARLAPGLGLAAAAAAGWGGYIVLTAHVGRRSEGLRGLAVALTAAAAVLAPVGAVQAWHGLWTPARAGVVQAWSVPAVGALGQGWSVPARVVLVALLVPLAAYALELAALRRLHQGVFGVWMALEPALGTAAGWLLLGQRPAVGQLPGLALVVAAGVVAAGRWAGPATGPAGRREPPRTA